ncbi:RNB domain-containing ribonuclease [Georgenia thermotolerans]|uniref:RNB domain-containing ribonuclease n=1 Tax=Georgenia thermotolerans TaxID=527326 RepID=A0A7J5UQC4_9MICO|nr:RNB domain-containing ribonuclease [Georgenia thermotolerans]KAE8764618.1 RNB domain-containing ribonuclease [Georgenia thermotolerans]
MPCRQLRLPAATPSEVHHALTGLREELGIAPGFPADVLAEAERAAAEAEPPSADATDVPFVTIDPPGSRDLDQAVHIDADGDGFLVRYAIASLATFVAPGGAVDRAAHERGVTVYGPAGSYPLHPPALSAGAASLLEGQERPAYVWSLLVGPDGALRGAEVVRARVRSRARLTYAEVQAAVDGGAALPDGAPAELPALLRTVGRLRQERERARGGVSLDIPEQEAVRADHGYVLRFRATLPVEGWNAQISLLTGIAAARMMRAAGVGIVRTLPAADPRDVARLRRTARALEIPWPAETSYGELLRRLDSGVPAHAAFLTEATTLFRGAGYLAFGAPGTPDAADVPAGEARHAAIGAEYAHVTAPLRRLVDRYGLEVCLAHSTGAPVPAWVLDALPRLAGTMTSTTRRANAFERGALDALEALVLEGRVGERFAGVVVDLDGERTGRGTVVLREPAVRARVEGETLPLGEPVEARLAEADVAARRVRFTVP